MKEQKIGVNGVEINYLKVGDGPKTILCLPGALGSIWSDFKPQLEKLDRSKFTLVAWDPPGYGKSRPPDREFSLNFLRDDADIAAKFVQSLGLNKISLLGWSDGGITAMILAAKYPQNVDRMLIWGANAYIVEEELKIYESIRDVSKWSEQMRAPLVALYGEEYFQKTWSRWVDTFISLYRERQGDICKDCLPLIQCRTLIAHGMKDPMIAPEHLNYLLKHIKASRYYVFPEGKHNIHLKYVDNFNKLIEVFMFDNSEYKPNTANTHEEYSVV
uniref:AB hydrolase-1 domain-containing protein n=1 Tax=Timema shepardi TaxID=629360 RepID=A0A7R9B7W2_TIMSH|nr:unnamed protein product [Timema shepardi]